MQSTINYKKAILFLVSGVMAIAVSVVVGSDSKSYGFFTGFGYTAVAGGFMGILYCYLKSKRNI